MPAKITINPDVMGDNRDALAVAYNEAYRVLMEQNDFEPQAEPTEEQVQFFADTAYANDPLQMKRTITARIATYDTSVPNPTPEQYQDVVDMLNMVIDSGAITNDEEESVVTSTLEDMEAKVSGGQGEQGMPPEGMPLEQLAPQEAMPPEGMEGMPPELMAMMGGGQPPMGGMPTGMGGMDPSAMGGQGTEQLEPEMTDEEFTEMLAGGAGVRAAAKGGVVLRPRAVPVMRASTKGQTYIDNPYSPYAKALEEAYPLEQAEADFLANIPEPLGRSLYPGLYENRDRAIAQKREAEHVAILQSQWEDSQKTPQQLWDEQQEQIRKEMDAVGELKPFAMGESEGWADDPTQETTDRILRNIDGQQTARLNLRAENYIAKLPPDDPPSIPSLPSQEERGKQLAEIEASAAHESYVMDYGEALGAEIEAINARDNLPDNIKAGLIQAKMAKHNTSPEDAARLSAMPLEEKVRVGRVDDNGTHTDLTMPSGERWRIYGTNGVGGVGPEAMKYMSQVSRDANYSTTGRFRREQMTKYLDQKKFTDIKISGEGVDRNAGLAERATAIAKDLQAKGDKAVASARKAYAELSALDPNTLPRRERLMLQTLGRALEKIPAEQAAQATPATTTPPAPPATTETKETEKAEENPVTIEETTGGSTDGPPDTTAKPNPEVAAPETEVLAEPTLTRSDEASRDLADGASAAISSTGSWAQLARDVVLSAKNEVKRLVEAGRLATDTVEKVNGIIKNLSNADPAVVRKAATDLRKLIPGEAPKELLESLGKLSTAADVKPLEVNVSKGLSVSGTAEQKMSATSQNAVHQIKQQVEQVPTEKLGVEAPKAPDMSVSGMEKFRGTLSPDELKQVELFESSGGKQGMSLQQLAADKYAGQVVDMFDKIPVEARANFLGEVQKAMAGNKAFPEKAKTLITAWAEGKPVDMGEFKKLLQDSPDIATGLNKALGVSSVGGKIRNSWVGKLVGKAGGKVGAFMMKHPKIAKSLGVAGTIGGVISVGAEFFKANELNDLVKAMEADLADIEKAGPLYVEDYDETVEGLRDAINIAKQRRNLSAISGTVGAASTAADFIPGAAPVAIAADVAMMAGEAGANYFINKTEQLLAESRAENKAARDAWKSAEGVYDRFIGRSIASDLGSVDGKTRGTYSDQSLNTLLEEQGGLYKEAFDQLMGNPNSQMAKTMKAQSWMKDNVNFSALPIQVRVEFFNKLKELGMAKAGGISKDFQRKRLIDREKARKSLESPPKRSPVEGQAKAKKDEAV